MRISQLAERTRTPATTLRYREQEGLVRAARTGSGYRFYTDADADRAGRLAELVVAEQRCCPFLTFRLDFHGDHITLTAHAPAGADTLVAALFGTARFGTVEEDR